MLTPVVFQMTCYRENTGKFKIDKIREDWAHFYIEINENESRGFKCPIGMKPVAHKILANAQFYINYIKVTKHAECCDR